MKIQSISPSIKKHINSKYSNRQNSNQNLLKNTSSIAFDSVNFKGKHVDTPIYLIDTDNTNNYRRFDDISLAVKETGTSRECFMHCLNGKTKRAGGYYVILAQDVDLQDEKGNFILDEKENPILDKEKYKAKIEQIPKITSRKKVPVYLIEANKEQFKYKRFDDVLDAAKFLSSGRDNLLACLKGRTKTTYGCFVVYAEGIETEDKQGKPVPDEEKLLEIYTSRIKDTLSTKKTNRRSLDVLS